MASLSPGTVETVGAAPTASTGVDWTKIWTTGINVAGDVGTSWWGGSSNDTAVPQAGGLPGWALPVAVGGIGIIAFSIFATKKKKRR